MPAHVQREDPYRRISPPPANNPAPVALVDITADVATTEEREQTEAACSARGGKPPPTPRRAQPSQPPDRAAEAARDATARPGLPAAAAEGAASCSRCRGPWAGFPVLFLAGEHDRRSETQRNRGPAATWKGGVPRPIPQRMASSPAGRAAAGRAASRRKG